MGLGPLLICGFGPFPEAPGNPSGMAVANLREHNWAPSEDGAAYAVLPTEWNGAPEAALAAAEDSGAAGILLVGVAVKAIGFQLELRAINRSDPTAPDAAGALCPAAEIAPGGPEILGSTAPLEAMLEAMRGHSIATAISTDAGAYICNHTYYRLLAEADAPVAFLHVPQAVECAPQSGFVLAEIERAVQVAAEAFAAGLRQDKG